MTTVPFPAILRALRPFARLSIAGLALGLGAPRAQSYTWYISPIDGHYYALTTTPRTWAQAELDARPFKGHLVTIDDRFEDTWLRLTFATQHDVLWTGLNDDEIEGQFVWASGQTSLYTNWCAGQPTIDPARNYVVLLGATAPGPCQNAWTPEDGSKLYYGILETALAPPGIAGVTVRGQGCATTTRKIALLERPQPDTVPALGRPFAMVVPMAVFGTGPLVAGNIGLAPATIPLDPLGMPGCVLYTPPLASVTLVNTGAAVSWVLPIPNDTRLIGAQLHLQALIAQAGLNALGVLSSNALVATLGRAPL